MDATLKTEGTVATNRKARHDYTVESTVEAGLVLLGTEVKSLRLGRVSIKESYARFDGREVFLYNLHISPYEEGGEESRDPCRPRKLLLHRHEIKRLMGRTQERGYTLIPLRIYFKNGFAKVELALAKGKRKYDKREAIKKREVEREREAALKHASKEKR
jgi:SsrA-binding protein